MRKYQIDEHYFDVIDSEAKAYFLGYVFTNGSIEKNRDVIQVIARNGQSDIIDILRATICKDPKNMMTITKGPDGSGHRIRLYSTIMVAALRKHGFIGLKHTRIPPPELPDELDKHFIRGLFDGGGCIFKEKNSPTKIRTVVVVIASHFLLQFIQTHMAENLSIKPKTQHQSGTGKNGKIKYCSAIDIGKVIHYLYYGAEIYIKNGIGSHI